MENNTPIGKLELAHGVKALITDHSRHYYGGYYHVCLEISAEVPLVEEWFKDATEYADAVRRLGASACFRRKLEKMAVPADELDTVRQRLLDSFDAHMRSYLLREDFPRRFVLSEYRAALAKPGFAYR